MKKFVDIGIGFDIVVDEQAAGAVKSENRTVMDCDLPPVPEGAGQAACHGRDSS